MVYGFLSNPYLPVNYPLTTDPGFTGRVTGSVTGSPPNP